MTMALLHILLLYALKGIVPKQNMGSLIRFLYPIMHKSTLIKGVESMTDVNFIITYMYMNL